MLVKIETPYCCCLPVITFKKIWPFDPYPAFSKKFSDSLKLIIFQWPCKGLLYEEECTVSIRRY